MKKYETKNKELIHLGDRVWYKKAEFVVERIYRNKLGQVMCELTSIFEHPKKVGDVLVLANDLSKEKPKSRYEKKENKND